MDIPENWTFKSEEIANNFNSHVREQLPWYDLLTQTICHFARHYIPNNGLVYDIGCSTGNIGNNLKSILEARNASLIGIDNSPEMQKIYTAPGKFILDDIVNYEFQNFDVAICFLTLMFIPVSLRKDLLNKLISKINTGGCLIVVDKVSFNYGYLSTILHRLTIAGKVLSNTPPEEIIKKELSLGGVQRPINPLFFSTLRITPIEFFRFGEFIGYIFEGREY